ncbi:hypothetical protein AAE478_007792 [Parahypoxylon ruwenzoriense]
MAQLTTVKSSQFHPGEQAIQRLLRVPPRDNPTHFGLPLALGYRVARSPIVAFGALDRRGRPWATIWGGEAGFCRPIAQGVLGVRATADVRHDPVLREFIGKDGEEGEIAEDNVVVRPEGGKLMAGLSIDLETRDRVKIAGRMVVGTVTRTEPGVGDLQLAVQVEESLGNCPKYLNKKHITPRIPSPHIVSEGAGVPLPQAAVDLIGKADMFFIASKHGANSMDTNHRGGPPGFVRIFRNESAEKGGVILVYPEYSGNRLYQTLGNLQEDPCAGFVVPDFETGDVLYLTGRTTILVADKAAAYMPHTKLAVRIDVIEARFVRDGLPFRGVAIDYSPYNPALRRLAVERDVDSVAAVDSGSDGAIATASLVSRKVLTPSISQYVFKLDREAGKGKPLKAWLPGQHVTLDFAPELDCGYSHMRDDDPQSLNDDFVRTFTVSSPVDPGAVGEHGYVREQAELRIEITARRHGPATRLLERWNLRVPLEIPVLGFGGAEGFGLPVGKRGDDAVSVFVAAGVGITPLMAQAGGVLEAGGGKGLRVLWSLKGEDIPLAMDVLGGIDGLGSATRLFVTGEVDAKERRDLIEAVRGLGAEVLERRMGAGDVLSQGEKGRRRFYCCTGPEMMRALLEWVEGEDVLYESFEY